MSARTIERPIAVVTTGIAVALAILLLALFALAFGFASASIGAVTQPPTDAGHG